MLDFIQKEIYKSGKITGAVRILKGQEILPDDSTLVQHNISNGDTVNVLIEPERNVEVEVQCGPKTYKHEVSNGMTVKQLKMFLIETNEVVYMYKNLHLVTQVTNKDAEKEEELEDDFLPLHYYATDTNLKLQAIGPTVFVTSENSFGEKVRHKIPRKATVAGLKEVIIKSKWNSPNVNKFIRVNSGCTIDDLTKCIIKSLRRDNDDDIFLFVACENNCYKRLDETDSTPLGELLSNGDVVYYIEDSPSSNSYDRNWPVYYLKEHIGTMYGKSTHQNQGVVFETVRSLKLRIQEEMGIPAHCITVYSDSPHYNQVPRTKNT